MTKAIIFDCFGVLTTEGFTVFRDKYFMDEPAKREQAVALMDEHTIGRTSYEVFSQRLGELAGVEREVVSEYLEGNKPNEPLFEFIRDELKPKYKIGMLSNTGADWVHEIFEPEQLELFDDIVQSYRLRLNKPDPRIYEAAAQNLGVEPKECVMVDDSRRAYEGALGANMQAVFYENFKQMKADLEKLLSAAADN
jgi:HAD superfamily hydrolase (TIGR01509 family)